MEGGLRAATLQQFEQPKRSKWYSLYSPCSLPKCSEVNRIRSFVVPGLQSFIGKPGMNNKIGTCNALLSPFVLFMRRNQFTLEEFPMKHISFKRIYLCLNLLLCKLWRFWRIFLLDQARSATVKMRSRYFKQQKIPQFNRFNLKLVLYRPIFGFMNTLATFCLLESLLNTS